MNASVEPPVEPPVAPPVKTSRRTWWIAAGAAGAAIVVGIGVAVALSKDKVTLAGLAPSGGRDALSKHKAKLAGLAPSGGGRTLDHGVSVQGHPRRQAYGRGYSLHRDIWIDSHSRGPATAA